MSTKGRPALLDPVADRDKMRAIRETVRGFVPKPPSMRAYARSLGFKSNRSLDHVAIRYERTYGLTPSQKEEGTWAGNQAA